MKINNFKQTNNKKIALSSFLLIGVTAATITFNSPFIGSMVNITILPYLLRDIIIKKRLKKYKEHVGLVNFMGANYYEKFNKNVFNYINKSKSKEERKYKILFSLLYMSQQYISPKDEKNEMVSSREVEEYNKLLIEVKITKNLIKTHIGSLDFKYELMTLEKIAEQLNNISDDELNIAKKVYKDFSNLGMLGRGFNYFNYTMTNLLLKVQDYKLTNEDMIFLQDKEINRNLFHNDGNTLNAYSNQFKNDPKSLVVLEKILDNHEESKDTLRYYFNEINEYKGYSDAILLIDSHSFKKSLSESLPKKDEPVKRRNVNKV